MNPDGPYLSVAAICDLVIDEKNDRVSCIRFADTVQASLRIEGDGPLPEVPAIPFRLNALISFKAGKFRGTKHTNIILRNNAGEDVLLDKATAKPYPMVFTGQEESGTNLIVNIAMALPEGMYWFDVYLDDELITKMPLKVVIQPTDPLAAQSKQS